MIRAHANAVRSLVSSVAAYVSEPPANTARPYVVVHPDQGQASTTALSGVSDWRLWRFQTTAWGETPEQAQWAAEKAWGDLLDAVPNVPGRTCTPIRNDVSLTVARDDDLPTPLFMARDVWAYSSIPT